MLRVLHRFAERWCNGFYGGLDRDWLQRMPCDGAPSWAQETMDAAQSRVFHVLEVCGVVGAHKQALSNHKSVSASIKAMSASVHEAEVFLNAAPTEIYINDPEARKPQCLTDGDARVEAIVSVIGQNTHGKALVSLKNLTAERYWDMRWQREWETKYHDPVLGIKRQEQEEIAAGHDGGNMRRREQRVRAALKDRQEKKVEFNPLHRAQRNARDFLSQRREGPGERRLGGRPRTAFGITNRPVVVKHPHAEGLAVARAETVVPLRTFDSGSRAQNGNRRCQTAGAADRKAGSSSSKLFGSRRSAGIPSPADTAKRNRPPNLSTFASKCPRFPDGPGWGADFAAKALTRLAKLKPPVTDFTHGALDSLDSYQTKKNDQPVRGNEVWEEVLDVANTMEFTVTHLKGEDKRNNAYSTQHEGGSPLPFIRTSACVSPGKVDLNTVGAG